MRPRWKRAIAKTRAAGGNHRPARCERHDLRIAGGDKRSRTARTSERNSRASNDKLPPINVHGRRPRLRSSLIKILQATPLRTGYTHNFAVFADAVPEQKETKVTKK